MTRFNELARIEAALANGQPQELRWALSYCEMRLRLAKLPSQRKTWTKRQVLATRPRGRAIGRVLLHSASTAVAFALFAIVGLAVLDPGE